MIPNIGDEMLAVFDLRRCFSSIVEVHIHVIDISRRVDRHFVLPELRLVVEIWPVIYFRKDFCCICESV